MSLAYLRDTTRKPFRVGAHVTVHGSHGTHYPATITGCIDDLVRVQDNNNETHLASVDDITF